MPYSISSIHPVFSSAAYQKDIVLMNVLDRAIRPEAFLLVSDGEDFVAARNRADRACWIWTSDKLTKTGLDTVFDLMRIHFAGREAHFTAKAAIADALEMAFHTLGYGTAHEVTLNAYRLDAIKPVDKVGEMRLAKEKDGDTLQALHHAFFVDCFDKEPPTQQKNQVAQQIEEGQTWLLSVEGDAVGFVTLSDDIYSNAVIVKEVYTKPAYRNRGCAAYMLASACRSAVEKGRHAILYADEKNKASNAAYRKVGFRLAGAVIEKKMKREVHI